MTDPRPNSPEDVGFAARCHRCGGFSYDRDAGGLCMGCAMKDDRPARAGAAPAGRAPSPAVPRHEPKSCRSCGAPIFWAQLLDEKGELKFGISGKPRAIPVDFEPSPEKGNVQLYARGGSIVAKVLGADAARKIRDAAWALGGTHTLRTSHFATCPNAAQHRRAR